MAMWSWAYGSAAGEGVELSRGAGAGVGEGAGMRRTLCTLTPLSQSAKFQLGVADGPGALDG